MIESVKVSNTHTLINQFGLFKWVYNIKHFLFYAGKKYVLALLDYDTN